MQKSNVLSRMRSSGFTMIELLIVIAILGILAVAVLAALNPIEQINRGRDTGSKSDSEQLISAIDRYTAFVGFYPWQFEVDPDTIVVDPLLEIDAIDFLQDGNIPLCNVLDKLSAGDGADCDGTDEVKTTFVDRIANAPNPLWIYNRGDRGDSTYVCFLPQSRAFQQEAITRCGETFLTTNLPEDLAPAEANWTELCTPEEEMVCLP